MEVNVVRIEGSDAKYQAPLPQMKEAPKGEVAVEAKVKELVQEKPKYEPTLKEKSDIEEYATSVGEKALIAAIDRANKKLEGVNTEFEFKVHEKTKQINIKVLNKETGELIREIPPEKVLDMVAHMWEMAGLLVDERR